MILGALAIVALLMAIVTSGMTHAIGYDKDTFATLCLVNKS